MVLLKSHNNQFSPGTLNIKELKKRGKKRNYGRLIFTSAVPDKLTAAKYTFIDHSPIEILSRLILQSII